MAARFRFRQAAAPAHGSCSASLLIGAVLLATAMAACGATSHTRSGGGRRPASNRARTGLITESATSVSVTAGRVHATLAAAGHAPVVNKPWPYSITVAEVTGHPLGGTVDIEFALGGQVVGHDTPPTHPIRGGRWHDTLEYPAAAVGEPLTFRAVVHTQLGSVTLNWPVVVRR